MTTDSILNDLGIFDDDFDDIDYKMRRNLSVASAIHFRGAISAIPFNSFSEQIIQVLKRPHSVQIIAS